MVSQVNASPIISSDTDCLDDHPGDMPDGSALDLGADRQPEQQHHDRHADAVVETAFQIERFAHRRRHCRIGHDRFAERRVGRRQYRRQQGHLQNFELWEDDGGDEKAEHDRQGQTDPQQPLRESEVPFDDAEIRVGGVGEQNHRERQFRQKPQPLAVDVDAQNAQPIGAQDKPDRGEHDRAADQRALDPAGDRAVDQQEHGQHRAVLVHRMLCRLLLGVGNHGLAGMTNGAVSFTQTVENQQIALEAVCVQRGWQVIQVWSEEGAIRRDIADAHFARNNARFA